jgi:hypothetical protein
VIGLETSQAELPRVNVPVISVTPNPNTPVTTTGQRAMTAGEPLVPQDRGYQLRWLVLGGIALVVIGAAATTAIMQPWSQSGPTSPSPPPAVSSADAAQK